MTRWIEALCQDLRYAIRRLHKTPGFTLDCYSDSGYWNWGHHCGFQHYQPTSSASASLSRSGSAGSAIECEPQEPGLVGACPGTDVAHWRADNQVFEKLEFISRPDIVAMSSVGSGESVGVQHMSAQLLPLLGIKAFMGTLPIDDVSENADPWEF